MHALIAQDTSVEDYIAALVESEGCRTVLDIGCGSCSIWRRFTGRLKTVGVDINRDAIEKAKSLNTHDKLIHADVLSLTPADMARECGVEKFDLVVMLDLIEHVPKSTGQALLEKCDSLAAKFVLVQTPNGFLPQGPEYGNEHQRHLSGWFVHDFEGMGYEVKGTVGPKFLFGYAGAPQWYLPGGYTIWYPLLSWLLAVRSKPQRAFSLIACKDVRGVPARLQNAG